MALSGMTGFARVEGALGAWSWSVEARSVNGRNLEVRYRGPNGFDALEPRLRESAQALFKRGQISVALHARFGFVTVGHFKEVGFKFGRWLDVVYMQRTL